MPKPQMLVLLTNSFAALNLIHSGLLARLAQKFHVYLMSDMVSEAELADLNRKFSMNIEGLPLPICRNFLRTHILRKVNKLLFSIYHDIQTFYTKYENSPLPGWIIRSLKLLRHSRIIKVLLPGMRNYIIHYELRKDKEDMRLPGHFDFVTSSSPFDYRENRIVNMLNAGNVKSFALIISWDNLTTKGVIHANHDFVFVWSEIMAAEYKQLYALFKTFSCVHIAGVPRFDLHHASIYKTVDYRSRFKQQTGINHERVLLFATSPTSHIPQQHCYVDDLLHYAESRTNVVVLLKPHPADYLDYSRYAERDSLRICLGTSPQLADISGSWLPDQGFLTELSSLLHLCDVCLHIASTIRLDAAVCDKPTINIAYDPSPQPYHRSIKKLYNYTHQQPLNRANIGVTVYSCTELYQVLDAMLDGSSPTHPGNIIPLINNREGNAAEHTLELIAQCVL